MEVPQKKLKIELSYDPVIPLLGMHPKKMKALIQQDACTTMFITVLFTIAKVWKQTACPSTDERVIKMCGVSLCGPMDCSLPGFSVRGILQARILEWVATSEDPFSRGSSRFMDQTRVSHTAGRFFTV